jgi:hypothetical protein
MHVLILSGVQEFERFLFPEAALEKDKKNQMFFDAKNTKLVGAMGKRAVAKRILNFMDPADKQTGVGVSLRKTLQ